MTRKQARRAAYLEISEAALARASDPAQDSADAQAAREIRALRAEMASYRPKPQKSFSVLRVLMFFLLIIIAGPLCLLFLGPIIGGVVFLVVLLAAILAK